MDPGFTVDILMSTFNGGLFLRNQLDSICAQTTGDWRLLVRDDGSDDETREILGEYRLRLGSRMQLTEGPNVGVTESFSFLLSSSVAPYVMFCDQDDVWMLDKVETMVSEIQARETLVGRHTPILVFSDLVLVDKNLKPLARSYWKGCGINPDHTTLNRLLIRNVVPGAACISNRALIDVTTPIPGGAMMYDFWLTLHASLFGEVVPLRVPTGYYRQHGHNLVGARTRSLWRSLGLAANPVALRRRIKNILSNPPARAEAILAARAGMLDPESEALLRGILKLKTMGPLEKRRFLFKKGVLFSNPIHNLALLVFA